jgi:uncharacterized protein YqeY
MSELLKRIKKNLKAAMTNEVEYRKNNTTDGILYETCIAHKEVSRAIISMFPEIGVKPDKATDDDVIKLLKRYINVEKTRELYIQKYLTEKDVTGLTSTELNNLVTKMINDLGENLHSPKITIAENYLPVGLTEEELIQWIKDNVDFSKFKNKIQAMGIIMKEFSSMDGNFVRKVLTENF